MTNLHGSIHYVFMWAFALENRRSLGPGFMALLHPRRVVYPAWFLSFLGSTMSFRVQIAAKASWHQHKHACNQQKRGRETSSFCNTNCIGRVVCSKRINCLSSYPLHITLTFSNQIKKKINLTKLIKFREEKKKLSFRLLQSLMA